MLLYILLAFFEYFFLILFTSKIELLKYNYISIKYSSFSFYNKDNKSGLNILIKIFFPTAYLIVVSCILYYLKIIDINSNVFYITIFYHIINWAAIVFVSKRVRLIDIRIEILTTLTSIISSLLVYYFFINKTTDIFIDFNELKNGIWLAVITCLFGTIIKGIYNMFETNISKQNERIVKYVKNRYNKFRQKYDSEIFTKNTDIRCLIYAIMIYENYNRPWLARKFEYLKLIIFKKATLGIMQVSSKKYISDKESIEKAVNIVNDCFFKQKKSIGLEEKIENVLFEYNGSRKYVEEVKYIYDILKNDKDIR